MKKKAISFLVSVSVIFGLFCPVFSADEASGTQKVLELIKPRILQTDGFENFESSFEEAKDGTKIYNFYWSTNGDNYSDLSVSATESGIITGYNFYSSADESYTGKASIKNKLNAEEMQKKAQKLVDSLNPSIKGTLLVKENKVRNLFSNDYYFSVQRYENSVPVSFDTGNITIDRTGENIKNFNISYTERLDFAPPENIITAEEAQKAYKTLLGTELKYTDKYLKKSGKNGKSKVIMPVYSEKALNENKYINAFSGEVSTKSEALSIYNNKLEYSSAEDKEASAGGSSFRLSEIEEKEIEKLFGILSKEKITEKLESLEYIGLKKGAKLVYSSLFENEEGEKIYNLRFENTGNGGYTFYSVNAEDGRVLSFNGYGTKNNSEKEIMSKDEAYNRLCDAAKYLSGDKFFEYKEADFVYPEDAEKTKNNVFSSLNFERRVNGIPYDGNKINIEINLKDESISGYSFEYSKDDFPETEGAISAESAYEKLFDAVPYSLSYILCGEKTELVYMFEDENFYIDPFSGALLDYSLNKKASGDLTYTDLENHYAKEKIEVLKSFGIGFSQKEFRPDDEIKQKDFLALLAAVFKNRKISDELDYDDIYRIAKRSGYITESEVSPESSVPRISAAKFLVRAMGYEPVAKIDGIFANTFSDVQNDIGYTAVLSGMKIINGDENGNFNPANPLSRADAAIIIYNLLNME